MPNLSLNAAPVEFFRPESQRPLDADGYEIDSATREIAEIDAWFASQADITWLNENPASISGGAPEWEPSAEDWRDYHEHCLEVDRLDTLKRMADHEYELRMRYGD
jgi:hypothetical protein